MKLRKAVIPRNATHAGCDPFTFSMSARQPLRKSRGPRSLEERVGRETRLVRPIPRAQSPPSSAQESLRGVSPASWMSRQKRFERPAKWCPNWAERRPGLIPTRRTLRFRRR